MYNRIDSGLFSLKPESTVRRFRLKATKSRNLDAITESIENVSVGKSMINTASTELDEEIREKAMNHKMTLKCKSCLKYFDSTFSVEEFSLLPKDQNTAGTLHLCPHCGNLSIYKLEDYEEPSTRE